MARLNSGFGPVYSQQGTPVVKDGVMYITTGEQDIFALDAKTGNLIWEYRTPTDPRTPDNKAKRGVALGEGMVFGVETDIRKPPPASGKRGACHPPALPSNQKTGKLLWKHELGEDIPKNLRQYVAAPPLYYKGLVYISVSGGDGGMRGRLTAHNAKTGAEVWRWWATPGPGEPGNDTWEGESWKTGGGAMWVQPALDPDLGLLYVNTGNPWPDYNGSTRGGDNLFTCSIVALDAHDGQVSLAFPSRPSRPLGLRHANAADSVRSGLQRSDAQGSRGALQARLGLYSRSRHGQAAYRNRREAGSAGAAAEDRCDTAGSRGRSDRAAMRRDG